MQREPVEAYIGLGANLGDPMAALRQALGRLAHLPHTEVLRASGLYGSTPVDSSGPDYVNAVACVRTGLTAPALLSALQAQENQAGRERPYRNAPRTLDLDVLLYGSARMAGPVLTVPHPRMTERAFVLMPLAEIAPDLVSATQLAAVSDQGIWWLAG
jgi:2-amino-4-hydroxy-6-hydroxymethyldihydropteridine diphosphokinase